MKREFRVNPSKEDFTQDFERSFSNASLQEESERNSFASQLNRNDVDMMEDLDRMSSFLKGVYNSEASKNILNLLLTPSPINASDSYLDLQEYYSSSNLEQ